MGLRNAIAMTCSIGVVKSTGIIDLSFPVRHRPTQIGSVVEAGSSFSISPLPAPARVRQERLMDEGRRADLEV